MKKLVLFSFILFSCFLITGCKKYGEKDVIKELKKSIEKSNGYNIKGELEIINNEDLEFMDEIIDYIVSLDEEDAEEFLEIKD